MCVDIMTPELVIFTRLSPSSHVILVLVYNHLLDMDKEEYQTHGNMKD